MSLPVPVIDDAHFESIVDQGRGLIPRYAGSWTDHNLHDPGMMLIDLIAWIVDQQIYTAGFLSDRHYQAFAALLGVHRLRAQPARGLLWPGSDALASGPDAPGVNLSAGARALCTQQPAIPFETTADVHITRALLQTPAQSTASGGGPPTIEIGEQGLELVFDRPLVETQDPIAFPVALGFEFAGPPDAGINGAGVRDGGIRIDYRLDRLDPAATPRPWRRLDIDRDETAALNRSGVILLRIPAAGLHTGAGDKRRSRLRIGLRNRLNPIPPRVRRVALNVLPVVQMEQVPAALVGTSLGQPGESFPIALAGIPEGRLPVIEVAEGVELKEWEPAADLHEIGPADRVFLPDFERNRIQFGNGVNGRIPPRGAQVRHRSYGTTAGAAGNLTSQLDWRVAGVQQVPGVTHFGTNPQPTTGGADPWDIRRLRAEARAQAFERLAMVTNDDLRRAGNALATLGVHNTDVLVGFHPMRPGDQVPGTRSLLVTPGADVNWPQAEERRYLQAIEHRIGPRRILGERLTILRKREVRIDVHAQIAVPDGVPAQDIENTVREALGSRLAARRSNANVEPWPPGRPVTVRELVAMIARVTGVSAVRQCRLARAGGPLSGDPVRLERDEVAVLGAAEINTEALPERGRQS